MINASNIFVKYGDRVLLDHVNLVIGEKDRVGLVGRNGAGKSTMLKIIAGYQSPDEGNVTRPSGTTLGFLHQEMVLPKGKTVMDEALTAFAEVKKLETRIAEINDEIANRTPWTQQIIELPLRFRNRPHSLPGVRAVRATSPKTPAA